MLCYYRWKSTLLVASILVSTWPSLLCSFTTSEPEHAETTTSEQQQEPMQVQISCSDYPSCEINVSLIRNATRSGVNHKACSHVRMSYHCQKTVTKKCEEEGTVKPGILAMMKRAYIYAEIHMQELCHSGSLPDSMMTKGGSHCTEFRSCFTTVKKYKFASQMSRHDEACRIASTIQQCATSSLSDCRRRGNLSSEALDFMATMSLQAGTRVHSACALTTTTGTTTPSILLPSSISCVDYSKCPRPDLDIIHLAKRSKVYHEACRVSKPYAQCIAAALEDCKDRAMVSDRALHLMKKEVVKANREVQLFCPAEKPLMMDEGVPLEELKATTDASTHPGSPTPTSFVKMRCLDIGSCGRPPIKTLYNRKLRGTKEYKVACNTMRSFSKCIEYATADCEKRKLITEEPLKSMVRAVNESKDIIRRYCTSDTKEEKFGDDNGKNRGPWLYLEITHFFGIAFLFHLLLWVQGLCLNN